MFPKACRAAGVYEYMKVSPVGHESSASCCQGATIVPIIKQPENRDKSTSGRSLWQRWKRVGKAIGDIQARILLVLFYFIVLPPFALALLWGSDPLAIKAGAPRGWRPRSEEKDSPMERLTRQS